MGAKRGLNAGCVCNRKKRITSYRPQQNYRVTCTNPAPPSYPRIMAVQHVYVYPVAAARCTARPALHHERSTTRLKRFTDRGLSG